MGSQAAWQVLVETARLKKGQKIFIHAGSGGVGTIAIQLAKHLGAFVVLAVLVRHQSHARKAHARKIQSH